MVSLIFLILVQKNIHVNLMGKVISVIKQID